MYTREAEIAGSQALQARESYLPRRTCSGRCPPPNLEGDSEELDDCVDEDAFSSTDDGEDVK